MRVVLRFRLSFCFRLCLLAILPLLVFLLLFPFQVPRLAPSLWDTGMVVPGVIHKLSVLDVVDSVLEVPLRLLELGFCLIESETGSL